MINTGYSLDSSYNDAERLLAHPFGCAFVDKRAPACFLIVCGERESHALPQTQTSQR